VIVAVIASCSVSLSSIRLHNTLATDRQAAAFLSFHPSQTGFCTVQRSLSTGSTFQSLLLLLTLTAGLSKQNNLSHSTPPKLRNEHSRCLFADPWSSCLGSSHVLEGPISVVPEFIFSGSISPPSHQCRSFPMNCTSTSVYSPFRC
jgi:hypothetical protein